MKKALFVDIDGTLTGTISGETFKQNARDIKVLKGVEKALNFYKKDWVIIGISNQGGVAAGYKSVEEACTEMINTIKLLPQIKVIYICTDFEGKELFAVENNGFKKTPTSFGNCRKPNPGMILKGKYNFNIDLSQSWVIGDRSEDDQAAQAAGVNFMHADKWRARFSPGAHEFNDVTPKELKFLEGIKA